MDLTEKRISQEKEFDGRLLHIVKDTVKLPNGAQSTREYNLHNGAVCIIPVDGEGNVVLERQYRYPVRETLVEIPAGKLDSSEEDPLEAARRELREETGLSAEKWTNLGCFYPAPAYSSEKITMFLAEGLSEGDRNLDEDEFLEVFRMPLSEMVKEVCDGKIPDIKTQASILRVARFFGLK